MIRSLSILLFINFLHLAQAAEAEDLELLEPLPDPAAAIKAPAQNVAAPKAAAPKAPAPKADDKSKAAETDKVAEPEKPKATGPAAAALAAVDDGTDNVFRGKLNEYLMRLEKTIDLIKSQILMNQSAPFLADLNLQYAELLSQRANALYYIEMEKGGASKKQEKAFDSVVNAQKESIVVLQNLLRDFPNFDKKKKSLLLLAVSLRSIDEVPQFTQIAMQIMREYKGSEEDIKARLYLAQLYTERGEYDQTKSILLPVFSSSYTYEKNLGRYRLAQVLIRENKLKEAMELLVKVVTDKALTAADKPQEVSLELKGVKQDLKREALIETIVPYTTLNIKGNDENPVKFYSDIAPTEALFQEAIEKLSFRYVFLREYQKAIRLLRTLVERLPDAAKVLNIYREVLRAIPAQKRLELDAAELDYVLSYFHKWRLLMETDEKSKREAYVFFEEQVRELATQSHSLASGPDTRKYLKRAESFYQLYLNHFEKSPKALDIAVNLAAVYFKLGDYTMSGETYLRVMRAEFGKPPANGATFLKNAILSLHKEKDTSFYQQIRVKGLMISSLQALFKVRPKERKNAELVFLLNRSRYEQGFFDEAIAGFYSIVNKAPRHPRAKDSANIILDYYNIRSDYKGLENAARKIAKAGIKDSRYLASLQKIEKQAQTQQLDRMMKEQSNFDGFAQAKGYFETALNLENSELKNVALAKALAKSRTDKDDVTFFKALEAMKKSEKDPVKRDEIMKLERSERLTLGHFYGVLKGGVPMRESADIALILKDWPFLAKMAASNAKIPSETKQTIQNQAIIALEGPVSKRDFEALSYLARIAPLNDRGVMVLYKNQARLDADYRNTIAAEAQKRCGTSTTSALCKWKTFVTMESRRLNLIRSLKSSTGAMAELEALGKAFESFITSYKGIESSGDAHLEVASSLTRWELFRAFGDFLQKSAGANPAMKDLLSSKANETKTIAGTFLQNCKSLVLQNTVWTPANGECFKPPGEVSFTALLMPTSLVKFSAPGRDPASSGVATAQKAVFADPKNPANLEALAAQYSEAGYLSHAAAISSLGLISSSKNPGLEARLGCALLDMGLYLDAAALLESAGGEAAAEQCKRTFMERLKY